MSARLYRSEVKVVVYHFGRADDEALLHDDAARAARDALADGGAVAVDIEAQEVLAGHGLDPAKDGLPYNSHMASAADADQTVLQIVEALNQKARATSSRHGRTTSRSRRA